jgi:hypothetical protein
MFPAFISPCFPWEAGGRHKEIMQTFCWCAPFITVARDHGSGEVVLDDLGRPVVRWDFDDEVDARLAVRTHAGAGAAAPSGGRG